MRIVQASPDINRPVHEQFDTVYEQVQKFECTGIASTLSPDGESLADLTVRAGLTAHAWLSIARDPEAATAHPEWLHAPQHHEWLRRFPDFTGGHPALVAPYIGLNTVAAVAHAHRQARQKIQAATWAETIFLGDVQGPPMGCGCGNPCCRSWDNAPGPKLASTPYNHPTLLFPVEFVTHLQAALPDRPLVPILCPECERGVTIDGVVDPDGPHGTDLCQGIPCVSPCATGYWPSLLTAFRQRGNPVGLLLLTEALGKNHPVFGEPRAWAKRAHRHYGTDLLPAVEPDDAGAFESALILTDAPQDVWPVVPPPGYIPEVPPISCGYCPPT